MGTTPTAQYLNIMEHIEFIQLVEQFNQEINVDEFEAGYCFSYTTNYYTSIITFGNIVLFNSEVDEANSLIELTQVIKQRLNEHYQVIKNLKYGWQVKAKDN